MFLSLLVGMGVLMGGSAELAPSTETRLTLDGAGDFPAPTPVP